MKAGELPPLPIPGMTTRPYGLGNPIMVGAWLGCLHAAFEQDEACAAFKALHGYDIRRLLKRTPIERMIDQGTGYERTVLAAWADFVTRTVWGEEEGTVDRAPADTDDL